MGSKIATHPGAFLAIALLAVGPAVGRAGDASPMPKFTGGCVYVADVPDRYQAVREAIRDLEAKSPRTYYAAVVRSTGDGAHAARDYAERLRDAWRGEAEAAGLKLDPAASVLVLAALDDRRVVVLPSHPLAERGGLAPADVEGLIGSAFAPLARAGDYPGALASLLKAIDARATTRAGAIAPAPAREVATAAASAAPTPLHAPTKHELAWSLGASVAVLAGMAALLVWLGRRRARGAFRAKLKDYKGKAVAMMDRLDALKARLKALPVEDGDFTEPMAGDTLALYEKAQEDLRKLWDRWLEVMDVVDRAEKHGGQGAKGVGEADKLVSDAKVFEEVEAGAVACSQTMDRLNAAHEDARAAAKAAEEGRGRATTGVEAVGARSLPVEPYRSDAERIATQARRADALLVPDPLGAKVVYERTKADADALAGRAGDVVARLEEGAKVQEGLTKLRQDVAARRRDGLRLDEDGGDPDDPAAQADQALAGLQTALEAGDPAEAAKKLAAARGSLDQARGVLDAVVQARDAVSRGLPEARRESRRLAEAAAQYAAFEQELGRDFAPASWQDVAGNLAQARALLETFDRKADEVEQAADPQAQKYLLASRLLGRLNLEQKAVFRLMNGVAERLTALKGVREQAGRLVDDLAALDREVRAFYQQYDHVVGGQARGSFQVAAKAKEEAIRIASTPRPDWPSALKALAQAREEYGIARSQAQSDLDVYHVLTGEYDDARRHASRVEAFLAGHTEDRPAANQHYRHAVDVLNLVDDDGTRAGNEWPRLLDQVRGARRDLEHSERLAREDVRLARQAEAEMAEAARTIREGRTFLSMGVGLDTAPAESMLSQAQAFYHQQRYEQSIQAAGSSIQQVRQAHQWAVQQAYARQMQVEAEQRRRAVAVQNFGMGAAVGAAGAMLGGAATAAAPERRPAPAPAVEAPEAASGSWESDAAEGSW
ncbi:MAG: hypothetical protein BGO49_05245 [Planctomycetales bacterium 71-10]|nr:MAG: hypothetical protein BGO49_05245 [Planctomycetales bacterium 71-10]